MAVHSRLRIIVAEVNMKRARGGLGPLSLRQIAIGSGLPPSVVTGLANGTAGRIDFKTIDKLCKYLQVQPGDLFEFLPDTESEE